MNLLCVIFGAALGAPLRYLTDRTVSARTNGGFPWGTFTVNMLACLALGVLTGATGTSTTWHRWHLALGTGLCATLSTYSTFSFETVRLFEQGAPRAAAANIALSLAGGVAGAAAGITLGQMMG